MLIRTEKINDTHIKLWLKDAAVCLPIETIKQIKNGKMPDDKYKDAAEFLSGENKPFAIFITKQTVKAQFESAI